MQADPSTTLRQVLLCLILVGVLAEAPNLLTESEGQLVPLVRLTSAEYPPDVMPGSTFNVSLTLSYNFREWILVDVGVSDAENGTMIQSRRVIFDKPENRIFSFQLASPSNVGLWNLTASARCWCADTWIQHPTEGQRSFAVRVVERSLKLEVSLPQFPMTIQFDGKSHSVTSGKLTLLTTPGMHLLTAPGIVYVASAERLVFESWSNGQTSPSVLLPVSSDSELTANYVRQYRVAATASLGTVVGSGWYDDGTSVTVIAIPPRSTRGILGDTPAARFVGWSGGKFPNQAEISFVVREPTTVVARWESSASYEPVVLIILDITLLITFFTQFRRLRRPKAPLGASERRPSSNSRSAFAQGTLLMFLIVVSGASTAQFAEARDEVVQVGNAEWHYWSRVPSDTCIIWVSGGLVFPTHQKINPYFLESYNTMRYVQDLTSQYCVVALSSGSDNLQQPKANRTLHSQSYYSASTFLGDLYSWLKGQGYSYVFLAGYSIGGVIAAHEAAVRNPNLWSTPNGIIIISTPLSSSVAGRASFLKSNLLLMYGATVPPLYPESGRSFYDRVPGGPIGEAWQHKEFHIIPDVEHEVWTRVDNGNYDNTAYRTTVAFIEKSKAVQFIQRIESQSLATCDLEKGQIRASTLPSRVPLRSVYNVWLRVSGPAFNSSASLALLAHGDPQVISVQSANTEKLSSIVKLSVYDNATSPHVVSFEVLLVYRQGEICKTGLTFSIEVRNPKLTILSPLAQEGILFDSRFQANRAGRNSVTFEAEPGLHTLQIPRTFEFGNGTRAIFRGWSDGEPSYSRTVQISDDVLLVAYYGKQHRVMTSDGGVARPISDSEWLDDGTLLRYSVDELQRTPRSGGASEVFFRWSFNYTATDSAGIARVSRPIVVAPAFTSPGDLSGVVQFQDDVMPWLLGVLIVLVSSNSYMFAHGRKTNRKPKTVEETLY